MRMLAVAWLLVVVAAVVLLPLVLPAPNALWLDDGLVAPGLHHILGTDELGRDLLSRLVTGARSSALIAVSAAALAMMLGTVLGAVAGYRGGSVDAIVRVAIDLFWSVPFVVFVVLVVSVVGVSPLSLALTLGCINWVSPARVVRLEVTRLRTLPFVTRARAGGAGHVEVLRREIFPVLAPTLRALTIWCAAEALTVETSLAFLGLSAPPPTPSWGALIATGLAYVSSAPWLVSAPAIAVVATLGSLQVLARSFDQTSARKG